MSNFINSFRYVPVLLFRLNAGKSIKLRDHSVKRSKSFDVLSEAGKVYPKALDPATYQAPNGASMRPLGEFQSRLVESFKGSDVVVYAIPEGTVLPDDLILVHEHTDHYSLQPAVKMDIKDLNKKITAFLKESGTVYSREEWLDTFEEDESSPQWIWSEEYRGYYYYNENGDCIWASSTKGQKHGNPHKKSKKR